MYATYPESQRRLYSQFIFERGEGRGRAGCLLRSKRGSGGKQEGKGGSGLHGGSAVVEVIVCKYS